MTLDQLLETSKSSYSVDTQKALLREVLKRDRKKKLYKCAEEVYDFFFNYVASKELSKKMGMYDYDADNASFEYINTAYEEKEKYLDSEETMRYAKSIRFDVCNIIFVMKYN